MSRRYSSSFSGIDWGFDLLRDSSRQELTKVQQDVLMSSLGEDKEEWRRTVISQKSNDVASTTETETETAQKSKKGGHSTQNRPSILSALNSWRGTLREMLAPLENELMTTNLEQSNAGAGEICPRQMIAGAGPPATLVTRRCSSQLYESDVDDDGFLNWK